MVFHTGRDSRNWWTRSKVLSHHLQPSVNPPHLVCPGPSSFYIPIAQAQVIKICPSGVSSHKAHKNTILNKFSNKAMPSHYSPNPKTLLCLVLKAMEGTKKSTVQSPITKNLGVQRVKQNSSTWNNEKTTNCETRLSCPGSQENPLSDCVTLGKVLIRSTESTSVISSAFLALPLHSSRNNWPEDRRVNGGFWNALQTTCEWTATEIKNQVNLAREKISNQ